VSKGTLYLYYPSKEELLKAVVRSTLAVEVAEGARLLDEHQGSSTDALLGPLVDWWIRVYNSPASGVFKLLLTEMCNFPELAEFYAQEVLEPGMGVMARLLTQGVARREFRPMDIEMAVHSIAMPFVMMCVHKHSSGPAVSRTCSPRPS
jgi:AcrR family transcriptional regulator